MTSETFACRMPSSPRLLTAPPRCHRLLHAQLAVDVVVEDDIGATLNSYKLIYLTDTHVTAKASTALASWVAAGGTLVATAGAGMLAHL